MCCWHTTIVSRAHWRQCFVVFGQIFANLLCLRDKLFLFKSRPSICPISRWNWAVCNKVTLNKNTFGQIDPLTLLVDRLNKVYSKRAQRYPSIITNKAICIPKKIFEFIIIIKTDLKNIEINNDSHCFSVEFRIDD